jgi:hypothetical protein
MTAKYDVTYPPRGRVALDGGLNTKYERSLIPDNESPSCLNVVFTNGAVETRAGSTKLNTAAVGSFAFDGVYTRRDSSGSETMVVFAGGTAWGLAGTSFSTIASAQSVFTAGSRVGTAQYENHMFIGNGGVTPYKYNGTAFTRHGVPVPSLSGFSGVVSATGGTFAAATYLYKVSYVNAQSAEGDVSSASTGLAVGLNGSVEITGIPVAPTSHGVSARRLYRASGTAGSYERIATISDNTTTTFSDTNFPAGAAAPTDNGEPPKYSVCVYHDNRLFMDDVQNPGFIWYTELFEPYTVKATNFIRVGDATGDICKGLDVYDNGIVVRGARDTYLNYMPSTDPTEWRVIRVRNEFGSRSPFGAFLYDNKLMYPVVANTKFAGFAALSGSSIDPEATVLDLATAGSDRKSDRIEPDMFQVAEAALGQISALVFKGKAYISVPYGSGVTANNRVYVFDFSRSNLAKRQDAAWSPLDGINAAQFTVYDGKLYYGSSSATGFVYQLEAGVYTDDGSAIDCYFWTKEFSGVPGDENSEKDFRYVKLLVEKTGAFMMNVTARTDSDLGEGVAQQVDLDPGSTLWDDFIWGNASWGGGTQQEEVRIPLALRGKRIQLKFSNQNTAGYRFKVHGMNFNYNVKGKR